MILSESIQPQIFVASDICSRESNLIGFSVTDLKSIRSWGKKDHPKSQKMSSFASPQRQVSEKIQQRRLSRWKLINLSANLLTIYRKLGEAFFSPYLQCHFELCTLHYGETSFFLAASQASEDRNTFYFSINLFLIQIVGHI